ncbi:MAG: hypothetical protein PVF58_01430 [Candidatus Methanofastidiosia archaeon]|jgi:hypothetical protein
MQIREEKLEESYSSTEPQQVISIPPKQQYNTPISTESIPSEMRIHQLNYEIAWMKNRIQELENQLSLLKEIIEDPLSEINIIDIREITIEEAKKIILEFYESHDTQSIYPSEVADELGLDLKTTAKAIDELLKEEKLEVANE